MLWIKEKLGWVACVTRRMGGTSHREMLVFRLGWVMQTKGYSHGSEMLDRFMSD
jgi:hypothetical protein